MSISPPKLLRCYIVGESVTVFPEEIRILEFESGDFIKRSTQCEWVQHSEWLNATKERRDSVYSLPELGHLVIFSWPCHYCSGYQTLKIDLELTSISSRVLWFKIPDCGILTEFYHHWFSSLLTESDETSQVVYVLLVLFYKEKKREIFRAIGNRNITKYNKG